MGLGILGLLVLLCSVLAQILLLPLHAVSNFHLPLPGVGNLQTWLGLGVLSLIAAWLLGDR